MKRWPRIEVEFLVKGSTASPQDSYLIRVDMLNWYHGSNKCKHMKLYQACKDRQYICEQDMN